MSSDLNQEELLSWKEIAAFLGVNVRTAQKWEAERCLPVQRRAGERGRVSANRQALAAWRASTLLGAGSEEEQERIHPDLAEHLVPVASRTRRWWPVAAVLVASIGLLWTVRLFSVGTPASYVVDEHSLTVLDSRGRTAFRVAFPEALDANYTRLLSINRRRVWIGDLYGDGHKEVLFVVTPAQHASLGHALVCFNDRGGELWRFVPGRSVRTRGGRFAPPYAVQNIAVGHVAKNGALGVVATSGHYTWHPNQIAILTPSGKLVGEYWHSGSLPQLALADFDHDGRDKIYLAGVNNARHAATLLVLDAANLHGATHEDDPALQLLDQPVVPARARLFFPPASLTRLLAPYNAPTLLEVDTAGITVQINEDAYSADPPTVIYRLTPDLHVQDVGLSDRFVSRHGQLYAERKLREPLGSAELAALHQVSVAP